MDRFQFSLLGLSAEEERMRLVSSSACEPNFSQALCIETPCADVSTPLLYVGGHVRILGLLGSERLSCCLGCPARAVLGRVTANLVSPTSACVALCVAMLSVHMSGSFGNNDHEGGSASADQALKLVSTLCCQLASGNLVSGGPTYPISTKQLFAHECARVF